MKTEDISAVIALLAERWPKVFSVYEARRRPLKIGIHNDLLMALGGAITPSELGVALRIYCNNRVYLGQLRTGAARIDLNGNPAGVVTAEEVEHVKARFAKAQIAARKQALHLQPTPPSRPAIAAAVRRMLLTDLRAAAQQRRARNPP